MRAKHLSAQQDQDVKDAYLSGLGCKKILRKLNITFGQVNAALRRLKVPKRKENDQLYRKYKIKETYKAEETLLKKKKQFREMLRVPIPKLQPFVFL